MIRIGKMFAGGRRGAMTLMEILIALFILSVGLLGILALFPAAIDSVGTMVKRTNGAQIAASAALSLQMGSIKLYCNDYTVYPNTFGRARDGADNCITGGTASQNYLAFSDWPEGIFNADGLGMPAGKAKNFRIPEDLGVDSRIHDGSVVTVDWTPEGYGWSAAFVPTETTISANTSYRVQIAIWRRHRVTAAKAAAGCTADTWVLQANAPDGMTAGDYVRYFNQGVWYKMKSVSGVTIELMSPTDQWPGDGADLEFASRWWLAELYETSVQPMARN